MGPFLTKWIWNKHKKSSAFWAYSYVCKAQKAPNYIWAGQHICATWHKDNYADVRIVIVVSAQYWAQAENLHLSAKLIWLGTAPYGLIYIASGSGTTSVIPYML